MNEALIACGCTETSTFSFISPKAYDKINLDKNDPQRESVVIRNPLGEDTSIMRTTILPSMLDVLSHNYNHKNEKACLYEIGTVYQPTEKGKLPIESQKAAIGIYGGNADYYALKGIVEKVLSMLNTKEYDIEPVKDDPSFHPGRTARFVVDGKVLAELGEIHPTVAENYNIGARVYVAEIDVNTAYENRLPGKTHKPLPKFPAVTRDLAFVCNREIPVLSLEKAIGDAVGKTLEKVKLLMFTKALKLKKAKRALLSTSE